MSENSRQATIVGGGPVGCVLGILLARRGFTVDIYEKRPDMRKTDVSAGRSINLVLTRRGIRALELIGLDEPILAITVPVLGRMMHAVDGALTYQPYGKDDDECNYSVSRGELNKYLLNAAADIGIALHFDCGLSSADLPEGKLVFGEGDGATVVRSQLIFGCDGAPSVVRASLKKLDGYETRIEMLSHGYKELSFPSGPDGQFNMAGHALHIWPRGERMLMALANEDGGFTGTIYLPNEGDNSFETLQDPSALQALFASEYPDALPLLGDFEAQFSDHPTGRLGTVRSFPWHLGGRVLMMGDAAHGVVPFFGQGLNCGFEDCAVFDALLDKHGVDDLEDVFSTFSAARKPNADAIADMALENFVEMSDHVGDKRFILRKKVEALIEARFTDRYRSRYAMVMYSSIPYELARDAGQIQSEILDEVCAGLQRPDDADFDLVEHLIDQRLTPFVRTHQIDLSF